MQRRKLLTVPILTSPIGDTRYSATTGIWELDCLQVAYTKRVEKETIMVPELMTRMEPASAAHGAGGTVVMQPAIQEYELKDVAMKVVSLGYACT